MFLITLGAGIFGLEMFQKKEGIKNLVDKNYKQ